MPQLAAPWLSLSLARWLGQRRAFKDGYYLDGYYFCNSEWFLQRMLIFHYTTWKVTWEGPGNTTSPEQTNIKRNNMNGQTISFFVAMHKETDKTHKYSSDSSDKPPWYLLEGGKNAAMQVWECITERLPLDSYWLCLSTSQINIVYLVRAFDKWRAKAFSSPPLTVVLPLSSKQNLNFFFLNNFFRNCIENEEC